MRNGDAAGAESAGAALGGRGGGRASRASTQRETFATSRWLRGRDLVAVSSTNPRFPMDWAPRRIQEIHGRAVRPPADLAVRATLR